MTRTSLAFALTALVGCATPESAPAAPAADAQASGPCSGGDARLPLTGLCPTDAEALIQDAEVGYNRSALTEMTDCTWTVNEAAFPAGEVLLYRAASCEGTTAALRLDAGAQLGELMLERSAIGAGTDSPFGVAIGTDPADPMAAVAALARGNVEAEGGDAAYAARCQVRTSGLFGPDAYVVDLYDSDEAAPASDDGPRADCGRYGYTEDSIAFWRFAHGFAWFVDLGQDAYQDIDPGSLTLVARGEDGTWAPVEVDAAWPADNYGVTNVVGSDEEVYGVEAPWTIYAGVDATASDVLYCVAEAEGGGIRIGYDGGQWQLGVPYAAHLDTDVEIDGRRLPLSGTSADGWTFGWLTLGELDAIRNGSALIVERGRASVDHDVSTVGPALDAVATCAAEEIR